MWKQSSKLAGTVFALALLLDGGCVTVPEQTPVQEPVAVTPALRAQYQQALESMKAGQWNAAIADLASITRENDRLPGPYLNLGIAYAHTGDAEKAVAALQAAIERKPANPLAYNQLGILYRQSGEFEQAGNMYEKALQADPDCADAHWNLAVLHDLYLQQPGEAQRHYERYRQLTAPDGPESQPGIAGAPQPDGPQQLSAGARQP